MRSGVSLSNGSDWICANIDCSVDTLILRTIFM